MTQITGLIREIYEVKQVSDKFKTREFVLTTEGQYPQHIKMQITQDRCSLLDAYNVGDTITAHYNLRGKQYTGKDGNIGYFNTVECWKIEAGHNSTPAQTPTAEPVAPSNESDNLF